MGLRCLRFIKAGTAHTSLRDELDALESERAQLTASAPPTARAVQMLPNAIEKYRAPVAALPVAFARDPERARKLVRRLVGTIRLVRQGKNLFAQLELVQGSLVKLAGDAVPAPTPGVVGSGGSILKWKSLRAKDIRIR